MLAARPARPGDPQLRAPRRPVQPGLAADLELRLYKRQAVESGRRGGQDRGGEPSVSEMNDTSADDQVGRIGKVARLQGRRSGAPSPSLSGRCGSAGAVRHMPHRCEMTNAGSALEQAVGEPARRGADVECPTTRLDRFERVERGFQLETRSATRSAAARRRRSAVLRDQRPRLLGPAALDAHVAAITAAAARERESNSPRSASRVSSRALATRAEPTPPARFPSDRSHTYPSHGRRSLDVDDRVLRLISPAFRSGLLTRERYLADRAPLFSGLAHPAAMMPVCSRSWPSPWARRYRRPHPGTLPLAPRRCTTAGWPSD